ncbi:MAG: cold shock domain-containing protein [Desulfofustis sp.]|nr:cold shock domain-containing protein [Desulfofustis sp.]
MQALVKSWIRDKEYGFLDNGDGPDIVVSKSDLIDCHYLKVGANVEFECHMDQKKLRAKKVKLLRQKNDHRQKNKGTRKPKKSPFGVMT